MAVGSVSFGLLRLTIPHSLEGSESNVKISFKGPLICILKMYKLCMCVYMHVQGHVCAHVCILVFVDVCMCACVCMREFAYMWVCACIYMWACMDVDCIYVNM